MIAQRTLTESEHAPPKIKSCQLCRRSLNKFDVPGLTKMWFCKTCQLYQYGIFVDADAYDMDYHLFYDKHRERKLRTGSVRLHRIESLLPRQQKTRALLDIGSSLGVTLEAAEHRGWKATGVDISRDTVQFCQQKGFDCYHYDGFRLPFEDGSFDVVTAWHVIEHVEDVSQTLVEWSRVLRPGGILVLETPDASTAKVRFLRETYRQFWKPEHTYAFSPSSLREFVLRAGLEILPNPLLGRWQSASPQLMTYEIGYQLQQGLKRTLGIRKGFRIFAQRPSKNLIQRQAA